MENWTQQDGELPTRELALLLAALGATELVGGAGRGPGGLGGQ